VTSPTKAKKSGAARQRAYRDRLKRGGCIVPVETDRGSAERHSETIGMQGLITVPIVGEFGLVGAGGICEVQAFWAMTAGGPPCAAGAKTEDPLRFLMPKQ
jgi:hypothetical protein